MCRQSLEQVGLSSSFRGGLRTCVSKPSDLVLKRMTRYLPCSIVKNGSQSCRKAMGHYYQGRHGRRRYSFRGSVSSLNIRSPSPSNSVSQAIDFIGFVRYKESHERR
jgi:hypothetical protein